MNTPQTDDLARGNHVVPTEWAQQLERERDEARESTLRIDVLNFKSKIKSQADRIRYLEGATNHAKGTPLSVALRERDEARQDLEHWKSEWEIVEARLCGWKHPRDNGIIFEHEVIPVLRKERDEARGALERIYQASMVARSLEEDFAEWEKAIEMLLDLLKKEAQ